MTGIYYILAAALVFLSWKSFTGGVAYLRFFRSRLASERPEDSPTATVFLPCRGIDDGLEANLSAFFGQDHPDFEVIIVVDSVFDVAVPVIRDVLSRNPNGKLVVAGAAENESQKVHNLREAVLHAEERSKVFVFADSDVRPGTLWLRDLIAPLEDDAVGCATGYRWFVSKRFGFAGELRSVWNASIASALGPNRRSNFCWGGSMAVRCEVFERLSMRDRWRGTLSDDFTMTRAMNDAGLEIEFVPQALCMSIESCGFRELFEFTTRQMKITRVYSPHLWRLSFVGSAMFSLVMVWSIWLLAVSEPATTRFGAAVATVILVSVFSIGKSVVRLLAVRLVLPKESVDRQWLAQCTFWMISPLLFLYNSICALFSRTIVWRGIRYELRSPTETVIVDDSP